MSPDEVHLVLASAVIGAILLGALAMVVDAHRNPFCKECYHCLKAKADREVVNRDRDHRQYHYWDREPCPGRDCPGLKTTHKKENR